MVDMTGKACNGLEEIDEKEKIDNAYTELAKLDKDPNRNKLIKWLQEDFRKGKK